MDSQTMEEKRSGRGFQRCRECGRIWYHTFRDGQEITHTCPAGWWVEMVSPISFGPHRYHDFTAQLAAVQAVQKFEQNTAYIVTEFPHRPSTAGVAIVRVAKEPTMEGAKTYRVRGSAVIQYKIEEDGSNNEQPESIPCFRTV